MDKKPLVSIIVPVYNCEPYIDKCLETVLAQTYENIEVICIDDESPDKCPEILDSYAAKDPRVKVVHQKNIGLSGARNTGLKMVGGQYIMFVDGDDWIDLHMVADMLDTAQEKNADAVMCCYVKEFSDHAVESHIFNSDVTYEKEALEDKFYRRLYGLKGKELSAPQDCDLLVSACMQLFTRKMCGQMQFIDTKKIGTEDLLYQLEIYRNCKKFAYIDRAFYHYRKDNETSLTTLYKPELYSRWQNLYDIIEDKISKWQLSEEYTDALGNRVALSMIGIGLNEIKADKSVFDKARFLKAVLKTPRYKAALKKLPMKYFPIHWWVFFAFCKMRMTLLLLLMLQIIEFLRKRVK